MTRPMSVELDLTRKPAAPAVANLAGQNLAGLGREGLRLAEIRPVVRWAGGEGVVAAPLLARRKLTSHRCVPRPVLERHR